MLRFLLADEIPRPLAAICAKATAIDRHERYADARKVGDDVLRFIDAQPVRAYRENVFERAGRWIARNRVLLALVAAYLLMRAIVFSVGAPLKKIAAMLNHIAEV